MALALEFLQEYLRDRNEFKHTECGVQVGAQPAYDAGNFYVGIDDGGVETGNPATDSLKEILKVQIGIWKRPEHLMKDQRGILKLPQDKYLLGAWTLHELERKIIVHKVVAGVVERYGLHGNYDFMNQLNARYNLPNEEYGAGFHFPFLYAGRGAMETLAIYGPGDPSGEPMTWYGYRLRFAGLAREQKFRAATHAIA